MHPISFISANFVARQLNYQMTGGWSQGDYATQAWFRPEETFSERFDAMLAEAAALGFEAIDVWSGHLNPDWASSTQIKEARRLLNARRLKVASLAFFLPDEPDFEKIAEIARALKVRVIGAGCAPPLLSERRDWFVRQLEEHDLIFGYENHPEKSPEEVLALIGGDAGGRIGVAVDTGWFGTQNYPADEAIRRLAGRIVHVHLKDIREPRKSEGATLKAAGHETCALGDGIVPVEKCVAVLRAQNYEGATSIEHEPEDYDPSDDLRISLDRVKSWIGDAKR